ncbi:MAG: SPFH domain-containing protein [Patescibacteria group bacterium]
MENSVVVVLAVAFKTFIICFVATLPYWLAVAVVKLGETDTLFTKNEEGQAKAIKRNGKFFKCVMSLQGHDFRGNKSLTLEEKAKRKDTNETEDELKARLGIDPWDIIPVTGEQKEPWWWNLPLTGNILEGLHWTGFPPAAEVHKYRFSWVASEYGKNEKGELVARRREEEDISHILIQDYSYLVAIDGMETSEGVPVNLKLLLIARSVNPYKSLFVAHRWLDAVVSQIWSTVRIFTGKYTYQELYRNKKEKTPDEAEVDLREALQESLKEQIEWCRREYGIAIRVSKIQSVDPADKDYRELSTKKYKAEREAEVIGIVAEADAKATERKAKAAKKLIDSTFGKMHKLAGNEGVKWLGIKDSKLTTYVESGSGAKPGILVPAAPSGETAKDSPEKPEK